PVRAGTPASSPPRAPAAPAPLATPAPAPASPPAAAAAPAAARAEKPLDRSAEWKRENEIGENLLKKNRNGFALERFQRVLAHEPNNARALRGSCIALDRLGRRNEAADACRHALRITPNDLVARRTLARVDYLGRAYSLSAGEWRGVLAMAPKDREARAGLRAAESHRARSNRSS